MKNRILVVGLITILIIILVTLTGCGKKVENDKEKFINLLSSYISEETYLNNKTFPAEGQKLGTELYGTNAEGYLSNILCDVNNDNKYEGLSFYYTNGAIDANLLEMENDEVKILETETLFNAVPNLEETLDEFSMTLFAIKLNNTPYFFLEINGTSSFFSDGKHFEIRSLNINDGKIIVSQPIIYEASILDDEEVKDYISKVKRMGLSMESIEQSVFSQNSKAIKIFEITRNHLEDFDFEKADSIYKFQYGNTTFKDLLDGKYVIELENVNTQIDTDNMEYEFKATSLGSYRWNGSDGSYINFELTKSGDEYKYILLYYENNANHASEELWGKWDVTKTEFDLNNVNQNSLAKYRIKNIKYIEDNISFDIEMKNITSSEYKDHIIPDRNYNFIKERNVKNQY